MARTPISQGKIYAYTTPAYRKTRWKGPRRGRGLIKVGFTTRDPHKRIREQIGASSPEKKPYELLLTAVASTRKGRTFTDKDVHRLLRTRGVRNVHNEWFEARPEDVRSALKTLKAKSIRKGKRAPARKAKRKVGSSILFRFAVILSLGAVATAGWYAPTQTLSYAKSIGSLVVPPLKSLALSLFS